MGFQVAQGNFVFLLFPLGSEVVREEIICVGLKRLGLPWAGAGSPLQGGASLTATDLGATELERPKGKASQDTQRAGCPVAGPVASFPGLAWSHVGG